MVDPDNHDAHAALIDHEIYGLPPGDCRTHPREWDRAEPLPVLRVGDRLSYRFPRTSETQMVTVRIADGGLARLESVDRERSLRSAWVSATDPDLIRSRDSAPPFIDPDREERADAIHKRNGVRP